MTEEGDGVGRTEDGVTLFVRGAVPGDLAEARVTKVKKRYAMAECLMLKERSPLRKEPCKWQFYCGGCAMGELTYEAQCEIKQKQVRDKLIRLAGIQDPVVRDIISMPEDARTGYRNKAVLAVGLDEDGRPLVGFRERGGRIIIDCDYCALQAPPVMAAAEEMRRFLAGGAPPCMFKHLVVKTAFQTGEVMVILIAASDKLPLLEDLVYGMDDAIEKTGYSLESFYVNINPGKDGNIFGEKMIHIAGKKTIRDRLMGLDFEISPFSFYQVNPLQAEKLYAKALEYAGAGEGKRIMDLYCGVGTIGLIAASRGAHEILGIESVHQAVLDANRNAVINGIVNARFLQGLAEEVLPQLAESASAADGMAEFAAESAPAPTVRYDSIILDPPRRGCHESLLDAVTKFMPERLVYISCNPGTLARDIKILLEKGFELVEVTPCDMFPETGSIESCALLKRRPLAMV